MQHILRAFVAVSLVVTTGPAHAQGDDDPSGQAPSETNAGADQETAADRENAADRDEFPDDETSEEETTDEPETATERDGTTEQASETAGERTTDGNRRTGSGARLDPAWADFHDAFLTLARGEPAASARGLLRLREQYPDHTTAIFARPVLDAFRDRVELTDTDIPPSSEWSPTNDHPSVQDRSSAVYDAAWARYREAFVALAGQETDAARGKLEKLHQAAPNHPSATLASEVMDTLDQRDPMLVQRESDMKQGDLEDDSVGDDIDATARTPSSQDTYDGFTTPIGWRIAAEGTGGFVGALAGGIGGGVGGFVLGLLVTGGDSWAANSYANWGMSVGALGTVPLGAYVGGNLTGADGLVGWTYLGGLAGVATNVLVALASPQAALVTGPVFILGGPIIGYELSHANQQPDRRTPDRAQSRGLRIRPFVTPNRRTDGGQFGLHLSF